MKVAVTGATGHLGGLIVRELHQRNHLIKVLLRGDRPPLFNDIPLETIVGDLENKEALRFLMSSCDAMIHCAANISINGDPKGTVHKTNVEGTRNVMEAAKASGIRRVIHISSIHAYRQLPKLETLDEHREKTTTNSFAYDRSKRAGEEIALSYASGSMDVIVLNPTSFISPYDYKPSKAGKFIIDLSTGKLSFLFNGGFDFCDGRDVAYALVNALAMGKSGENYLLSGKWITLKEISNFLSSVSGRKIKVIELPLLIGWIGLPFMYLHALLTKQEPLYTNEALVAIRDGNRMISSAKAILELNYNARPMDETIGDTYNWFLKNGYLG
jgi:dihydroflavonol-4-reductase